MTKLVYSNGDYVHINEDPVSRTIGYSHGLITEPHTAEFDGMTLFGFRVNTDGSGPWITTVNDVVFDFRDCPVGQQDEVISLVCGANVHMYNCAIFGGIKAILAGNGDHPIEDRRFGTLNMHQCFIGWSGRRCPEAQSHVVVGMTNCWLHDWGSTFDTKAFGAYAKHGAFIQARNCLFTQTASTRLGLGLVNTVKDIANHIGQAVHDHGIMGIFYGSSWVPGIARGLGNDAPGLSEGRTRAITCYRNRDWIRLGESNGEELSQSEARNIAHRFDVTMPSMAVTRLGMSFATLFNSIV